LKISLRKGIKVNGQANHDSQVLDLAETFSGVEELPGFGYGHEKHLLRHVRLAPMSYPNIVGTRDCPAVDAAKIPQFYEALWEFWCNTGEYRPPVRFGESLAGDAVPVRESSEFSDVTDPAHRNGAGATS
jgi:hypothetical protein